MTPINDSLNQLIQTVEYNIKRGLKTKYIGTNLDHLHKIEKIRALNLVNNRRERSMLALDIQLNRLIQLLEHDHGCYCNMSELSPSIPYDVFARGVELNRLRLTPHEGDIVVLASKPQIEAVN